MPTIQIKHRYTDTVLFECGAPDGLKSGLHFRYALEKAAASGADLRGADLSGADLSGADLSGEEKFIGKRPVFSIGPIGSRQDTLMAFTTDQGVRLKTGCFFGSLEKFRAALIEEHDANAHREEYEAALLLIEKHAALWPGEQP